MTQSLEREAASDPASTASPLDEALLCRRLEPVIRMYALRRLRGDDAVHDFVQQSLLIMLQALRENRVTQTDQVAPYAIGVCRNLLRDGSRSGERRRRLLEQYGDPLDSLVEPSPYVSPLGRARLEDCVSKLQRRAREVVRRAFYEEQSNIEIAAELGLGEGNVRVIRHRSLETLKSCLERPMSWSAP